MKYNSFLSRFILTLMLSLLSMFGAGAADNEGPKFKTPDFAYPQTVLNNARALLKTADTSDSHHAGEIRLRAALEICSAAQSIDYDSIFAQPAMLSRLVAESANDPAAKSMLTLYEAKLYANIYTARKYKYDRVDAPLEPYPDDVSAWSGLQFRTRIATLLANALAEADTTALSRFSASLDYSPEVLVYLPTVADFVRFAASRIYSDLRTPSDNYLAERKAICTEGIKAAPEGSAPYFYWSCALIELENKGDRQAEAFEALYDRWKDREAARYVLVQLAERSQDIVSLELAMPDDDASAQAREASEKSMIAKRDSLISMLETSLSQFPTWNNNNALRNSLNKIRQPHVSIEAPSMVAPGTSFTIDLSYSFAKKITVSIHALPDIFNDMSSEKILSSTPSVFSQQLTTDKTDGIISIPASVTTPGKYAVVMYIDNKKKEGCVNTFIATPLIGMAVGRGEAVDAVATDFNTGAPLKNVKVNIQQRLNHSTSTLFAGTTDGDGVLVMKAPSDKGYSNRWLTFAYKGRTYDFNNNVRVYNYHEPSDEPQCVVRILTDRSIYHPGDSIKWAVVLASKVRRQKATVDAGIALNVTLYDANGQELFTDSVTTDAMGRAYGSFPTEKGILTGYFSIRTQSADKRYTAGQAVMVSDFKAPEIEVNVTSVKRDTPMAGFVTIEGRVSTYSGMPVGNAKVDLSVTGASRWRWFIPQTNVGSVSCNTDSVGNFNAVIPAEMLSAKYNNDMPFTAFTADITATSEIGETATTAKNFVTGKPYALSADIPGMADSDKPFTFTVNAYDADGAEKAIPLRWDIQRDGKTVANYGGETTSGKAVTVDFKSLPSDDYKLCVRPADSALADTFTSPEISFYSISKGTMPQSVPALFVPDAKATVKNGKAEMTIGANCDRLYVYCFVSDDNKFYSRSLHKLSSGFSKVKVDLPDSIDRCSIKLVAVYKGSVHTADIEPERPSAPKTEIIAESFRNRLVPGTAETWRFRLMHGNGILPDAAVIATMYNRALEALQHGEWPNAIQFSENNFATTINNPTLRNLYNSASTSFKWLRENSFEWPAFKFGINSFGVVRFKSMLASAASGVNTMATNRAAADMIVESAIMEPKAEGFEAEEAASEDSAVDDGETDSTQNSTAPEYREAEVLQAFWMPNLVTDSEGNVDIEFTVPNANGQWQFKAFGWDKDARSAAYTAVATANKPVMVQPNLPRYLRQGDTARILATVFNNSEENANVVTTVEIFDIATGKTVSSHTSTDEIAAMKSATVGIDVEAPATAAAIGYRVRAVADNFSDGEQSAIPVLSSAATVIESTEFYLNPGDSTPFTLTVKARKNTQLTLQYCQNPIWTVVKAMRGIQATKSLTSATTAGNIFSALAARYIVEKNPDIAAAIKQWSENPTEEALTSMLAKNETLKKLMLDQTPWVQAAQSQSARMAALADLLAPEKSRKAIAEGKAALARFQQADGGFAWGSWSNESSPWSTECVLTTLGIANSLGMLDHDFDNMLQKAFTWLQNEATKPHRPETDRELALISTLFPSYKKTVEGNNLIRRTVGAVASAWRNDNSIGKAYDVLVHNGNGRSTEAAKLLNSIRQFAVTKPGMGLSFPNIGDIRGYATVIQAYKAMNATAAEIDALRQWVIVQAQANDDLGAYNPDYVIAAILLTGSDWTSAPVSQNVTVNGKPLEIDAIESASGYFTRTLPAEGKVTVTVTPNGVTPSYGSVISIGNEPMKNVKARPGRDLSIEKRFLVEEQGKWIETDRFALGQRVRVQLTVKAGRNLEYVSISDERPAAFEPVDQLPGYVWDGSLSFYRENLDATTNLFISYLPQGTYHITFDMTAAVTGTFISGITTLQSQYAPELTAHSAGNQITVE